MSSKCGACGSTITGHCGYPEATAIDQRRDIAVAIGGLDPNEENSDDEK